MADKRRGLGRGLGALIPSTPSGDARPVDVFFPGGSLGSAVLTQEPVSDEYDGTTPDSPAGVPHARTAPEAPSSERAEPAQAHVPTREPEAQAAEHAPTGDQGVIEAQRVPEEEQVTEHPGSPAPGVGRPPTAAGDRALVPVPGARFAELPVGAIRPNPRQPRSVFDQDALAELVGSIQEIGVLQPVVVRPVEDPDAIGGEAGEQPEYELIMGERRWRATQQAGLATIPAIVRETDDSAMLRDALLENLHRSDLNPLEEAAAYQQLLDDFGCTHEELAARIHRSRPQISNMLRLLRLPPTVQRRVAAGVLSSGHARALLGLADAGAMERLAQRIVAEGLSVRTTEEIVALGGEGVRPVRRPRSTARNEALDGLAAQLSDRLETRVKIELGRSKGRMTVEFASVEDLNRILETLSPQDARLPA